MSRKKEVRLGDADPDEHVIVFYRSEMTEIICPHQPQSHSTKKDVTRKRRSKGRTTKRSIPNEIKDQVEDIVKRFNKTEIRDPNRFYIPRYRGKFLYLDRDDYGFISHVCRLEYTGDMNERMRFQRKCKRKSRFSSVIPKTDNDDSGYQRQWITPFFFHIDVK